MAGGLPHPVLLSTFMGMDEITLGGQVIEFKHVFYSWVCMAILFTVAFIMRRRLTLVPGGLQNFFEALIDTIERFVCSTMGEVGRKYVPLLAGMFIYIFGMNLMGLIPGFDAPTANLNTTVCMALFVLVSAVTLALTRPMVRRLMRRRSEPTNLDRVVGETGRVTETIDNTVPSGAVYVGGKTWTARSSDGTVLPIGTRVIAERMEGVKLYVKPEPISSTRQS